MISLPPKQKRENRRKKKSFKRKATTEGNLITAFTAGGCLTCRHGTGRLRRNLNRRGGKKRKPSFNVMSCHVITSPIMTLQVTHISCPMLPCRCEARRGHCMGYGVWGGAYREMVN